MKKENKRMAQQKRAEERERKEKKQKIFRTVAYWGPVVLAVIAVIVVVVAIATSGRNGNSDLEAGDDSEIEVEINSEDVTDDTSTAVSEDQAGSTLSTEAGLEAKNGDKVNIDFVGKMDGKEFEGGSSQGAGYDLVLGSNTFIAGFEDGVVGHKVGETFDLNLKFPDDYGNQQLAGKDVVFTTTLNGIYQ